MTALALKAFLTLLFVIDPVGLVPVFLSLAGARPAAEQARIARKSVLVSAGLIAAFGVGGGWLLHHLSISFDAFRVAGGIQDERHLLHDFDRAGALKINYDCTDHKPTRTQSFPALFSRGCHWRGGRWMGF